MNYEIYYRVGDIDGCASTETREAALDKGSELIDLGAEILDVKIEGKETLRTELTVAEILFESAQRHKHAPAH